MEYKFDYTLVYNGIIKEVGELWFATDESSFEEIKENVENHIKAIKTAYLVKNKLNKTDLQHIVVSVVFMIK